MQIKKHFFKLVNYLKIILASALIVGLPIYVRKTTKLNPLNYRYDLRIIINAFKERHLVPLIIETFGILLWLVWVLLIVELLVATILNLYYRIRGLDSLEDKGYLFHRSPVGQVGKLIAAVIFAIAFLNKTPKLLTHHELLADYRFSKPSLSLYNCGTVRTGRSQLIASKHLDVLNGTLENGSPNTNLGTSETSTGENSDADRNLISDKYLISFDYNSYLNESVANGNYSINSDKGRVEDSKMLNRRAFAFAFQGFFMGTVGFMARGKFSTKCTHKFRYRLLDNELKLSSHNLMLSLNRTEQFISLLKLLRAAGIDGIVQGCIANSDSAEFVIVNNNQSNHCFSVGSGGGSRTEMSGDSLPAALCISVPYRVLNMQSSCLKKSGINALETQNFLCVPLAWSGELWLNLKRFQIISLDCGKSETTIFLSALWESIKTMGLDFEIICRSNEVINRFRIPTGIDVTILPTLEEVFESHFLNQCLDDQEEVYLSKLKVIVWDKKLTSTQNKFLEFIENVFSSETKGSISIIVVLGPEPSCLSWTIQSKMATNFQDLKVPVNRTGNQRVAQFEANNPREISDEDTLGEVGESPEIIVRLLGQVDVLGAEQKLWRPRMLESLVYFALHPDGVSKSTWVNAIWPDQQLSRDSLNTMLWQLRKALGSDKFGNRHFPISSEADSKKLKLAQSVTTDFILFKRLSQSPNPDDWCEALKLIRGRPFEGITDSGWLMFEGHLAEVDSIICKCAIEFSEHCFDKDDPDQALWSARQGLLAVPYDERLWRIVLRATYSSSQSVASLEAVMQEMLNVLGYQDSVEKLSVATRNLYDALCRALLDESKVG
jgi:two-component SAPR family response regulator